MAEAKHKSQQAVLRFQRANSYAGPYLFSVTVSAISPGTLTCQLGSGVWVRFHTYI